jgi:mono/diheme cytochrome c family protein
MDMSRSIGSAMLALALMAACGSARIGRAAGQDHIPPSASPTFSKDIAPILFQNCASCHHPGEVAPFSLLSYRDAKKHAREIAQVTQSRQMPPWKPVHGFGEFVGERRLTDEQIASIAKWVAAGKPEGNAADLPAAPIFVEGWQLGTPDLVVKMPEAYTLKAEGNDVFRCFVIPLNLTEDKYVQAVEFRPSNRKIVHHSLFYLDTSGRARQLDARDPGPGYEGAGGPRFAPAGGLGGWAPGVTPRRLPDGIGRLVPKGADLVIQTHFHPSGKVETEQSSVGLYFLKKPPENLFISTLRGARRLDIPAGKKDYEIRSSFTVPSHVVLQGVFPHAHLLCKEIEVTATLPDGKTLPIIWIKDWNWDWQDEYLYRKPLDIPKGTRVDMRFRYDNSMDNPRNPTRPPRRVRWGEQTSDEMALVFFQLQVDRPTVEMFSALRRLRDATRSSER